jgi:hypothetical protein
MHADQLTNPRSNVQTACPERSEGFKRFHLQSSTFNRYHLILEKIKIQKTIEEQMLKPPFLCFSPVAHLRSAIIHHPRAIFPVALSNECCQRHLLPATGKINQSIVHDQFQPSILPSSHLFLQKANSKNKSEQILLPPYISIFRQHPPHIRLPGTKKPQLNRYCSDLFQNN